MSIETKNAFLEPTFAVDNLDRYVIRLAVLRALQREIVHFTGRFLDVGAGNQPYRSLIESNSTQVTEYVPLDLHDNWHYKDAANTWDGVTMPLADNSFDSAMATEVLEHCPHPEVTLSEISRVLKPGGLFFFTVPFVWPLHDCPHDEYRYTPWSLERHLKNSGFTDIKIAPTGGWDATLAQVLGLWVRRRPFSARKRKVLSMLLKPVMAYLIRKDDCASCFTTSQYLMPGIAGTARVC